MGQELPTFNPGGFFEYFVEIPPYEKKSWEKRAPIYLLPETSEIYEEEGFAKVFVAFDPEGLYVFTDVHSPLSHTFYPEVTRGDSLELFLDTRNNKSSAFNTKFCHHFFFLPKEAAGVQKGEMTRFRGDNSHKLCSPEDLRLDVHNLKERYQLEIFISKSALVGYDPSLFKELGISYRINRFHGMPQHFSGHTSEFKVEAMPSLWAHGRFQDESSGKNGSILRT